MLINPTRKIRLSLSHPEYTKEKTFLITREFWSSAGGGGGGDLVV
jgi:hypothetical protein